MAARLVELTIPVKLAASRRGCCAVVRIGAEGSECTQPPPLIRTRRPCFSSDKATSAVANPCATRLPPTIHRQLPIRRHRALVTAAECSRFDVRRSIRDPVPHRQHAAAKMNEMRSHRYSRNSQNCHFSPPSSCCLARRFSCQMLVKTDKSQSSDIGEAGTGPGVGPPAATARCRTCGWWAEFAAQ